MSELALKLIAENKAKHARGEDARVLDLGNCGLTEVPKEVEELVWLEKLILWGISNAKVREMGLQNDIRTIKHVKTLSNLKCLDVNRVFNVKNKLSNISSISSLTKMEELYLISTNVSDLSPLSELKKLKRLKISDTPVVNLAPISGLIELEHLDCFSSKISNVDPLKNLINLKQFYCGNTNVYNIDPILYHVKQGTSIEMYGYVELGDRFDFSGCPLTNPPVEIVAQGNFAILRYFEDLEKQGSDQIYEAKLLLIGEGGAGKTTLCRKLFDPNAPLPQEKNRTRGIDIHPLYFDLPGKKDKQFRLNIWDFAGQGKYQLAHSFFYTHRSLYVLVDDTRTLNENDAYRTLYNNWLQTAELFGGKSPVLVLHNEKDGCARTGFSLGGFQERFEFVHGELFRINLGGSDTAKIEDLRRQIERQALALPHIGDTVPKTWVKVREAIEAERQAHPYISAERYCALCADAEITDPERQLDLSRYFHDLGVFLHFQDNPLLKRDVFLQNQWVTDAVYKILDDAQIAGAQRGRFDKKDLARLWNESAYRNRRDELLALMLQFELCYQVQDTETYICPQMLPGDLVISDVVISDVGVPLQLKYEYVFMPKGLLCRLIVRLHRHIAQGQTAVWNTGALLERAGAKADVLESLDRRTISVRATGVRAKELVTLVHDALEGLHEPFGERLKVALKIPCNCRMCKASDKPHFYDKMNLDNRLSKGKMTVECDVSFEDVPVLGLLDGVFARDTPSFDEISRYSDDKQRLKLFISYSKHDQHYKDTLIKHLSALRNQIVTWHDRDILPGEDWDERIKAALHEADIVLYLATHNSLATNYIQNVELPLVEQRCAAGGCILVPVIVNFCVWTELDFAKRNALPEKGIAVVDKQWVNENEAWVKVVEGVQRILAARRELL